MVTPLDFTQELKSQNHTLNKQQAEISHDTFTTFSLSVLCSCWFYAGKILQWAVLFSQLSQHSVHSADGINKGDYLLPLASRRFLCRLSVACFSLFLAVDRTPMKAFGLSAFYLGYLRYSLQGVSFSFLFLFWFTLSFFLFCFFFFEDKIFGRYYSNLLTIAGKQLFTCDT